MERESDPAQTVELLEDWERAYGLPDHCTPLNATVQRRQAALVARIASQGAQSIAYYVSPAATLGYCITITEFQQLRAGSLSSGLTQGLTRGSRVGDPLCGPVWRYRDKPPPLSHARSGSPTADSYQ